MLVRKISLISPILLHYFFLFAHKSSHKRHPVKPQSIWTSINLLLKFPLKSSSMSSLRMIMSGNYENNFDKKKKTWYFVSSVLRLNVLNLLHEMNSENKWQTLRRNINNISWNWDVFLNIFRKRGNLILKKKKIHCSIVY